MEDFQTLLLKQQNNGITAVYLSPSSFQVIQTIVNKVQGYFVCAIPARVCSSCSSQIQQKLEISCLVKNWGHRILPTEEAWNMDQHGSADRKGWTQMLDRIQRRLQCTYTFIPRWWQRRNREQVCYVSKDILLLSKGELKPIRSHFAFRKSHYL